MQHHQHHWQIRILGAGVMLLALAGLSGCGKSARSTFTEAYFKDTGTHTKTQLSMQVKDMTLTDASSQKALKSVLGTCKASMTMLLNQKKNQLSIIGKYQKIAGAVIIANNKAYISGNLVATAAASEATSGSSVTYDKSALNKLKGKYLAVSDTDYNYNLNTDSKQDIAFTKAVRKAWIADFNKFDTDSFKKNGNVITHRVTAKDVTTLADSYNKVVKSKKAYKQNTVSKDDISDFKTYLKKFKVILGYNTKSDEETVKLTGGDSTSGIKHINVITTLKTASTKQNVKVPSTANTISESDVEAALQPKMSDKTFNSIMKTYKQLPKASRRSYMSEMKDEKDYFTDSQWQQMEKLAK